MLPDRARIAVVSPSSAFDPSRLTAGLAVLRDWGYRPTCLPYVGTTFRYLAGDDASRRDDLVAGLAGDWDAVWMVRGGYGLARLLRDFPWDRVGRAPFVGFSDGTAFLNPLADRGLRAIHGPVLTSLADHVDEGSRAHLRALLKGDALPPLPGRVLREGTAAGPLAGGNLCVLASLCGTPWQLRGAGRIVVIEEVGEAPYRIDRLLRQVIDAGCLDGAAGFALGAFHGCEAPPGAPWSALDVVIDALAPFGVPVLAELPIGHGRENYAFEVGAPGRIEGDRLVLG